MKDSGQLSLTLTHEYVFGERGFIKIDYDHFFAMQWLDQGGKIFTIGRGSPLGDLGVGVSKELALKHYHPNYPPTSPLKI